MAFISFTKFTASPELWDAYMRWRYREFVGKLGWNVPNDGERETGDEWDVGGPDETGRYITYIAYVDQLGEVHAATRLIPCTRPCMLAKLWPGLSGSHRVPSGPRWCEGTRTAVDANLDEPLRTEIRIKLAAVALEWAYSNGFRFYSFVTYDWVGKVLDRTYDCTFYTQPLPFGEAKFVAGHYPIDLNIATGYRQLLGFTDRLLEAVPAAWEQAA